MIGAFIFLIMFHLISLDEVLISKSSIQGKWTQHKLKYKLTFLHEEDQRRMEIFKRNYKFVMDSNAKNSDIRLKMNQFGHLVEKHEMPKCLDFKNKRRENTMSYESEPQLPVHRKIDWRKFGIVSNVKNQDRCGSCYAFSAVGAVESHFAKKVGFLVNLSEQEIVDCSTSYGNQQCEGGFMDLAFEYMMANGLSNESSYQYTGYEEVCLKKNKNHTHKLLKYNDIKEGNEHQLVRALSFEGPVSIAIDANHDEFTFYEGGVIRITSCDSSSLNHGVLAVGYEIGDNFSYLLVKNSWGEEWGTGGYFKIALFENNMCGIATAASYPIPLL
ncbi:hypothetical protein MXB_2148 [Myxobolus squamalis]|nr:hypothetical protein MXB_2148 [Myxobolus squamalis]